MKKFFTVVSFVLLAAFLYLLFKPEKSNFSPDGHGLKYAFDLFRTVTVDVVPLEQIYQSPRVEIVDPLQSAVFQKILIKSMQEKFNDNRIVSSQFGKPYTFQTNPLNLAIKLYVAPNSENPEELRYILMVSRSGFLPLFVRMQTSMDAKNEYDHLDSDEEVIQNGFGDIFGWEKVGEFNLEKQASNEVSSEEFEKLSMWIVDKMNPQVGVVEAAESSVLEKISKQAGK